MQSIALAILVVLLSLAPSSTPPPAADCHGCSASTMSSISGGGLIAFEWFGYGSSGGYCPPSCDPYESCEFSGDLKVENLSAVPVTVSFEGSPIGTVPGSSSVLFPFTFHKLGCGEKAGRVDVTRDPGGVVASFEFLCSPCR
jgi:hypothetical protein